MNKSYKPCQRHTKMLIFDISDIKHVTSPNAKTLKNEIPRNKIVEKIKVQFFGSHLVVLENFNTILQYKICIPIELRRYIRPLN